MHLAKLVLGSSAALLLLVSACAGPTASASTQITSASTTVGASVQLKHRNHGGVLRLIAVSLKELSLTDAQRRTLEGLRTDLLARMQPARDASRELADALAEGVSVGVVDPTKAEAAEAKLREAALVERQAQSDALSRLHATLDAGQRAELMDRMQALWSRWHEEWESAGTSGEPPPNDVTVLSEKLGLSADQTSRIQARLETSMRGVVAEYGPRDVAGRAHSFAEAFRADELDASAVNPPPSGGTFGATRMTRFFEAFAPELTPGQRVTLAQMIRDHAQRHDQP